MFPISLATLKFSTDQRLFNGNAHLFYRMFEFEAELPFDNLLTIQVKDWDLMTLDDFIGETKIDIENRFYSKHRARCGLPDGYHL